MRTRGAKAWVRKIPTGFPDWMRRVFVVLQVLQAFDDLQVAIPIPAAFPAPPYTMSSSGFSATSRSRLFMSIRRAASVCQLLQGDLGSPGSRDVHLQADLGFLTLGFSITFTGLVFFFMAILLLNFITLGTLAHFRHFRHSSFSFLPGRPS